MVIILLLENYQLYRAHIYRDNDNSREVVYVVSSDWFELFNILYERLGNKIKINAVELVANENIDFFVDNNYVLNRSNDIEAVSITGISKFANNY